MRFLETFKMALFALRANKLRSALTLIGIIAGVASIIAVMTGISVVQNTMEQELSVLGTTTFQVQKWPLGFHQHDVDWREVQRWPPTTVELADAIRERAQLVDLVGPELWSFGFSAKYRGVTTEANKSICGGSPEYSPNNTHEIGYGRNLTQEDLKVRRKVVVIGPAIADELFPFVDPLDKEIRIDGRDYRVVGVFAEKASAMGGGFDNYLLIPITAYLDRYGMREPNGNERSVNITVRAKSPELVADAFEEVRGIVRQERGLGPRDRDNFEIFTNDSQIRQFNQATAGVKLGAFVIGTIALIVAGIGIMNIMLVSVTERTREIGVRKSIGAKRRHILGQFLLEAILLCNVGGVLGVAVGFGMGNIVTFFTDFYVHVPLEWAVGGLLFCTTIGLIFGMWPAMKASRLNPIEALRWE